MSEQVTMSFYCPASMKAGLEAWAWGVLNERRVRLVAPVSSAASAMIGLIVDPGG